MTESDWDLIQACRQGNARAWNKLLDKYERLVFSIPLNYGFPYEDAADIVQITFTILIQSLDSLRTDTRLAPWLATVARRHTWRLLERHRRESPNAKADLRESSFLLPDESSRKVIERWELVEWLEQGFALLDERCTQLLLALYFDPEKPTYAEIAETLDMPIGSIGPTRARCLERLRHLLPEQPIPRNS
jgi:RNA polymerase sigma factor (sigma-70 family)